MLKIYQFVIGIVFFASPAFLFGQGLNNVTDVNLTFTPVGGGSAVTATANDPDGDGPMPFQLGGAISLLERTEYTLSIEVESSGTDLTTEIDQNSDDYLFFFSFTDEVFTSPAGDGNTDNRQDPINYNDLDGNNLPIGLSSDWETECGEEDPTGSLQIVLKYQEGIKSETSTVNDGDTEFDITWDVTIEEDPDAPPCENEEEIITDVTLTFTPVGGGDVVTASAQDPDGEGPLPLQITQDIELLESTEYEMSITILNSIEGEDITEEIMEEDDEHMFFFAFTDELFINPAGDGNTDNREDPVNYNDFDENNLPVGLSTNWETECGEEEIAGTFQVILKHQPDIKSETSTVNDGGTDVDLTWDVTILEDPDAPPCENEEEIITDVTLTFTPVGGGDVVTASAQDPDGEGPLPLQIVEHIELLESTEYEMSITLLNSIEGEDITEEIMEEDDEHMFFFAFTDEVFTSPAGDGNTDNREDPVNYNDFDENNLPVGLSTNWETECGEEEITGTFQVILKHQPDIKSETSTVNDGGTDVDLTFDVTILEDPDAPPCENEEEIITDVTLTFTPVAGGSAITASAQDPDGEGPLPLQIVDDIILEENTEYEMSITVLNSIEGEDITEEIMEEDHEHMFFFEWTDGLFTNPTGNGNADNRPDPVNYNDFDENNLPVGLSTNWETQAASTNGEFRVVLKHQPDIKSETSTINDGGTDVDLTWNFGTVVSSSRELALQNAALKLAPNPVSKKLNWLLEDNYPQEVEVLIFDQFGRMIRLEQQAQVGGWSSIEVETLARGAYYLQIRSAEKTWTQRFLKTN